MNVWEYLAFGGLERVLLIAAAILISYWGYHLYGKAQIAGLSMIAVAALLLMSVVLTSGQHQETVSASVLASNTATMPAAAPQLPDTDIVAEQVASTPSQPVEVPTQGLTPEPVDSAEASADPDNLSSPFVDESIDTAQAAVTDTVPQAVQPGETVASSQASSSEPATIERLVPLASGSELGGRIVSVRSENVTLEWSAGDSRRRIISESSTQ